MAPPGHSRQQAAKFRAANAGRSQEDIQGGWQSSQKLQGSLGRQGAGPDDLKIPLSRDCKGPRAGNI